MFHTHRYLPYLVGLAVAGGLIACDPAEPPRTSRPSALTTVDESTPIGAKWAKAGGAAVLGQPTTEVLTLSNGDQYQQFEHGVIVLSTDWGAVLLSAQTFQKWLNLAGATNGDGQDLFRYIGSPVADETLRSGARVSRFERGQILVSVLTGSAFAVYGTIHVRYADAAPALGLPVSEEGPAINGGRVQVFENGEIYFRRDVGAHAVTGPTRGRWLMDGGPGGSLGYPTSEVAPVIRDGAIVGEEARFQHGAVFHGPTTNTWTVPERILRDYEGRYGGAAGWLGLPTWSGTTATGTQYVDFQDGMLVLSPILPGTVWAFQGLELFWERMDGYGSDCVAGICGNQDIYMITHLVSVHENSWTQYPASGTCDGGCTIHQTKSLVDVVNHDFRMQLTVDAWDADDTSDDDYLGRVQVTYDIDNLFGLLDAGTHHGSNGDDSFDVSFSIRNPIPYNTDDWVHNLGWSFPNFSTPELTYQQFAKTFSDVGSDEYAWRHPFNRSYYELLYKGIASGGDCFGMSLTSAYAQKNQSLWAEPIYRFPKTPEIVEEVNLKHGYQIGAPAIDWFLGQFVIGATHDPKGAFESSEAAYARGDYPTLVLTTESLGGAAHAVRPYRWEKTTNEWKMWIYDNNYPGGLAAVTIDPQGNTFNYGGYQGGDWSGGRMYQIPFHVLGDTPRTPFWEIMALLRAGTFLLVGSGAETQQITDADGRTFFDAAVAGTPTRWDQVERDPSRRIPDLSRVPLVDGPAGASSGEIYAAEGTGKTYRFRLAAAAGTPAGTPYEWTLNSPTLSANFSIPVSPGHPDLVSAEDLGTPSKAVSFQVLPGGTAKRVDFTIGGAQKQRWANISGVQVVPGQTIRLKLANAGYSLVVDNDGPTTSGELTVQSGPGAPPVVIGQVSIPGGQTAVGYRNPVSTLTLNGGQPGNDGWLLTSPTVLLSATDYSGKGIDYSEYRVDDLAWTRYAGPFAYGEEGATLLAYRSKDKDGNLEAQQTRVMKVDTRPPVVTASVGRATYQRTDRFVVEFAASDPVPGSGLASTDARLDGSAVVDGEIVDLLWMALGPHTLTVTADDVAGQHASVTATFEVVATAASLRETIRALFEQGEIDQEGIERSLLAKVSLAESADRTGDRDAVLRALRALANEVRAQSGKHVTERAADLLLADIAYITER